MEVSDYILGLDVSTQTIGIAIFENMGNRGELRLLQHVSPRATPKTGIESLIKKAKVFEDEFLQKYKDIGISKVIIEEPLLGSNNVYTVATLLKFNGMISKSVYEAMGIAPEFISSYDARKYGFPELMQKRTHKKNGEKISENSIKKAEPVLFGAYPYDVDKKSIIFNKVANLEPKIVWLYDKKRNLKKENYDSTDAYCAVIAHMKKNGIWA